MYWSRMVGGQPSQVRQERPQIQRPAPMNALTSTAAKQPLASMPRGTVAALARRGSHGHLGSRAMLSCRAGCSIPNPRKIIQE